MELLQRIILTIFHFDYVTTSNFSLVVLMAWRCVCLAYLLFFFLHADCLTLQIEPKTEQCFYEDVKKDDSLTVFFDVTRGGLLDIVLTVYFNGQKLESRKHFSTEAEGRYHDTAVRDGTYKICFDNMMSRWTAKVVDFDILIGEIHHFRKNKESPDSVKMSEMLLSEDLKSLEYEADRVSMELERTVRLQKFLQNSEKRHRDMTDESNSRALYMALLEASILLAISGIQIFLVRNMFKNRSGLMV